ncbi:MAG: hypothetical protein ABSB71_09970 [Candidatus Bathyarchaeia archaeon]|jgi:hypothetical protein
MSEHVEVDYLLNLRISDKTIDDLRRIEANMMKIAGDLNRIFGNSTTAKIMKDIQILIMLYSQALVVVEALKAAMSEGASLPEAFALIATVTGAATSMAAETQGGGV